MKKAEFIARYGEEAYQRWLESKKRWRENNPEYNKQYQKANRKKIAEYNKRWREEHKEEIAEYKKQWREDNPEYNKQYHQANRKKIAERHKQYQKANRTKITEQKRQYRQTQYGRASNLCSSYQRNDKQYNRGECTLIPQWIIDNIFTSKCYYCGDDDWTHLGADRINNDLPHTPENCICACGVCNIERQIRKKSVEEFKQYRSLHPRELNCKPEVNWEITELPSGLKVIKKK